MNSIQRLTWYCSLIQLYSIWWHWPASFSSLIAHGWSSCFHGSSLQNCHGRSLSSSTVNPLHQTHFSFLCMCFAFSNRWICSWSVELVTFPSSCCVGRKCLSFLSSEPCDYLVSLCLDSDLSSQCLCLLIKTGYWLNQDYLEIRSGTLSTWYEVLSSHFTSFCY